MLKADAVGIIVRVMAPYIGETMARSATDAHCRKLGIGDTLPAEQREALLARLGSGLSVFLGRERAGSVVADLRAALLAAGEA